jgi:hypothetical protein
VGNAEDMAPETLDPMEERFGFGALGRLDCFKTALPLVEECSPVAGRGKDGGVGDRPESVIIDAGIPFGFPVERRDDGRRSPLVLCTRESDLLMVLCARELALVLLLRVGESDLFPVGMLWLGMKVGGPIER